MEPSTLLRERTDCPIAETIKGSDERSSRSSDGSGL